MGLNRYINKEDNKDFICAVYLRLSNEDGDKEESNSITRQREIIDYYLKKNKNIKLYDYYIDDGWSGTNFNRPSFQRILDDIESRKINTVIVKDLSRFGRNYIEVGNFIETIFPAYNIRFIAINDKIDNFLYPETLNSMLFPFKNMINEEYCRDISKKIKSAKLTCIKKGQFMAGHAPYGYIKNPKDKHFFIIDPVAAEVVKKIYEMFLNGNGYTTITKYLNDSGIYPPSKYKCITQNVKYRSPNCTEDNIEEKKWEIIAVKRVLQNQVYCGDQVQCKQKTISHKNHKIVRNKKDDWIIVENTHEPIISREDFQKVQSLIKDKNYEGARKGCINMYAGHLRCAECGKYMLRKYTGKRRTNKSILNYNYYCSTYKHISENECTKHMIRSEVLDNIVLKAIKHQIKLYLHLNKAIESLKILNSNNEIKNIINRIENEIKEKRKLKQKLYEDWKLSLISKDDYLNYVDGVEKTINVLNNRLKKYTKQLEEEERLNSNIELFNRINEFKNISILNKDIVDEFIDKIYVHENNEIEIVFRYQDEYMKIKKYIRKVNSR